MRLLSEWQTMGHVSASGAKIPLLPACLWCWCLSEEEENDPKRDSWLISIKVTVSDKRREPSHQHSSRKPEKASPSARNWLGIHLHGWPQVNGKCGHSSPAKITQPLSKPWAGWAEALAYEQRSERDPPGWCASPCGAEHCQPHVLTWVSDSTGTSVLGDWRQWVRIKVTGSWAGKCSCGHPCVSSLFPTASCSLGTTGSHRRHCRRGEEQQLLGKPMPAKICIWLQSQEDWPALTQIMQCIILPRVFLEILFRFPDNSQTALVALFGVDWQ